MSGVKEPRAASLQAWGFAGGPAGTAEHELRGREAASQEPSSGTLAPGGAICGVTGFPRVVGSLWRGGGRRRGPLLGLGLGALLDRELGLEFVKGGTESAQEQRVEGAWGRVSSPPRKVRVSFWLGEPGSPDSRTRGRNERRRPPFSGLFAGEPEVLARWGDPG